jgi:uncharacterized membrane protein
MTNIDYREVAPPATSLEKQFKLVNTVLIIAMVVYAITNFASLPAEIPMHFNAKGEADDWGNKAVVFVMPGICIFLYFMMNIIGTLKPSTYNFPVALTKENAKRQVELARKMMQGLNISIFAMFFYILWRMVAIAKGATGGLGTGFMVFFIALIFGILGYYMYLVNKAK